MRVFVNNKAVEIFEGAKVIDALNCYASDMGISLPHPVPTVTDQYGNEVALDGMLSEGASIKFINI